jgi:DNA repair exonuclease SbcCD ATPase subunit
LKARISQLDDVLSERDEYRRELEGIADLENVMACLKQKADLADRLQAEIKALKQEKFAENSNFQQKNSILLEAENNFLKMRAQEYEKLETELALMKSKYHDLSAEKKDLREQLLMACGYRTKYEDLKKLHDWQVYEYEKQIENLTNLCDKQDYQLKQQKNLRRSLLGSIEEDVSYLQVSREIGPDGLSTVTVHSIESSGKMYK